MFLNLTDIHDVERFFSVTSGHAINNFDVLVESNAHSP